MKKNKQLLIRSVFLIILACLYALSVIKVCFFSIDNSITDKLYEQLGTPASNIIIVSIEDSTLEEYGSFSSFSRVKTAELIEYLNRDPENAPSVIGVDLVFSGETNEADDARLVEAVANSDNVILASANVYRAATKVNEKGIRYIDENNIQSVSEPYDALSEVSEYGFANAVIDEDAVIRRALLHDEYEGATIYSFDSKILNKYGYAIEAGETVSFFYIGKPGEYQHFSMERVLRGEIPDSLFKDSIVLVGAYASGLMDSYIAPVDRSVEMYGVEIHANLLQALMEDKTYKDCAGDWVYLLVTLILWIALFVLSEKLPLVPAVLVQLVAAGAHLGIGRLLSQKGIVIPQFYFLLLVVLTILYLVAEKYFVERWKKKKVLDSFKKYVAPQVVDGLSKNEDFETKLGGRKKDIAVLFVDIRGFTPLSESLQPEQVVGILDEYLALTTECIFKNNGTLDKFIGDATMAMFNAPFDLYDYEMWAIKTALDIRAGGDRLSEVLYERYGKKVHFGIGVNCGDAVVGNIGCDIRMDYTAIGDTVNTAARLESKAAPDEILISPMLYERVKERVLAEQVGELALKGKAEPMLVYRVIGLKEAGDGDSISDNNE